MKRRLLVLCTAVSTAALSMVSPAAASADESAPGGPVRYHFISLTGGPAGNSVTVDIDNDSGLFLDCFLNIYRAPGAANPVYTDIDKTSMPLPPAEGVSPIAASLTVTDIPDGRYVAEALCMNEAREAFVSDYPGLSAAGGGTSVFYQPPGYVISRVHPVDEYSATVTFGSPTLPPGPNPLPGTGSSGSGTAAHAGL